MLARPARLLGTWASFPIAMTPPKESLDLPSKRALISPQESLDLPQESLDPLKEKWQMRPCKFTIFMSSNDKKILHLIFMPVFASVFHRSSYLDRHPERAASPAPHRPDASQWEDAAQGVPPCTACPYSHSPTLLWRLAHGLFY